MSYLYFGPSYLIAIVIASPTHLSDDIIVGNG